MVTNWCLMAIYILSFTFHSSHARTEQALPPKGAPKLLPPLQDTTGASTQGQGRGQTTDETRPNSTFIFSRADARADRGQTKQLFSSSSKGASGSSTLMPVATTRAGSSLLSAQASAEPTPSFPPIQQTTNRPLVSTSPPKGSNLGALLWILMTQTHSAGNHPADPSPPPDPSRCALLRCAHLRFARSTNNHSLTPPRSRTTPNTSPSKVSNPALLWVLTQLTSAGHLSADPPLPRATSQRALARSAHRTKNHPHPPTPLHARTARFPAPPKGSNPAALSWMTTQPLFAGKRLTVHSPTRTASQHALACFARHTKNHTLTSPHARTAPILSSPKRSNDPALLRTRKHFLSDARARSTLAELSGGQTELMTPPLPFHDTCPTARFRWSRPHGVAVGHPA